MSTTANPNRLTTRHFVTPITFTLLLVGSIFFAIAPASAAANPAYDLDQCANGKLGPPVEHTSPCEWVNGNLGESKSHYTEGQSIPYRAALTNIPNGNHYVLIEYDTLKGGKHAIDYATSFQRISETVDPCAKPPNPSGYPSCVAPATFAVPAPSGTPPSGAPALVNSFNALPTVEREFSLFKATAAGSASITDISYVTQGALVGTGDVSTRMRVDFTVTGQPTLVLAWGGHIASSADWGAGNSSGGISGSPYHMRIIGMSINGAAPAGGNQDRSLGAAAVVPVTPLGASLTVVKLVDNANGGTAVPADFTMHVRYAGNLTDVPGSPQPGDNFTGNTYLNLPAGSYVVTEDAVAGYTQQSITGNCAADGTITLVDNDIAECTVTNAAQLAHLVVIKHAVNLDGGTLTASNWTMSVTGGSPSLASFPGSELPGTNVSLLANAAYDVTESGPAGYAFSFAGDCTSTVGIPPGQTRTCTVTNDDIAPTLTVIKHVINDDGGALQVSDVQLKIDGVAATNGTAYALLAGPHVVSEVNPTGYAASAWSGACAADGTITLALDQDAICEITNNDIAPTLTVIKHIVNDDGGALQVSSVVLMIDAGIAANGTAYPLMAGPHQASEVNPTGYAASAWSGACAADGTITLALDQDAVCEITNNDIAPTLTLIKRVVNDAGGDLEPDQVVLRIDGVVALNGTAYTLLAGPHAATEDNPVGYAASVWSGACAADGTITLALDQDAVCEVTNDDIAPTLTVIKHVINNDGGTLQVSDVILKIDGVAATNGTAYALFAGAHTASEINPTGYAASAWSGACAANGAVGLVLDQDATCEITNDDIAPTLTVIKHVINDDGGTLQVSDVILRIDGAAATNGTAYTLLAGPHTVTEVGVAGYAASAWSGACAADGTITLALDQDAICEITNNDIAPTLTVVKHVINDDGGTLQVSDVVLRIDGVDAVNGTAYTLMAGAHTVTEVGVAGYAASVWSGACAANGTITLALDQDATCEITNNDIAPTLTLIKHIVNDDGGTVQVSDVVLRIDGVDAVNGTAYTLLAGPHAVSEVNPTGYAASAWSGACAADGTITLALDQDAICEITDNDIAPTLTVIKHVVNDDGGTLQVSDVALRIDGVAAVNGTAYPLMAGPHAASEVNPAGYAASAWTGACAANGTITLALAQDAVCEITDDDIAPILHVVKLVVNNGLGTAESDDFLIDVTGIGAAPAQFLGSADGVTVDLDAGAYSVAEVEQPGYAASYSADCSGTMLPGDEKTCTITNDDIVLVTRTQGFWDTHTAFTRHVFQDLMGGSMTVGTGGHVRVIDSDAKLFAAWESSVSKLTSGAKRSPVDQARMVLLQQLVTAKINCAAFGCDAATQALIVSADAAYAGTDRAAMSAMTAALDAYNNSGDDAAIPPALGVAGAATSRVSKAVAATGLVFWNTP